MNFHSWNQLSTHLFLEELSRQGLKDIFIAPGSRSTPLVLAAAKNKKLNLHTHFDERGLGYFALGCAKKTNLPTAVITTSGTAVSNLLPATTEAFYGKTPLLILSADRPFELIDVGANQAIQQKNIFQNAVHSFFDIPSANQKTNLENILTLAGFSYHEALSKQGPVHLNFKFQEPLAPVGQAEDVIFPIKIKEYLESTKEYTKFISPKASALQIDFDFNQFKNPLIIFGSQIPNNQNESCLEIAKKLNATVFCDVQNHLRRNNFEQNIFYFDILLDIAEEKNQFDAIFHFGGPLTSKRLNQFIEKFKGAYIQINPSEQRLDPQHKRKVKIKMTAMDFVKSLNQHKTQSDMAFSLWRKKSDAINSFLTKEFQNTLNEMNVFHHLSSIDANYFIGSSMPIRDLERFSGQASGEYFFNRGASGIDGNIATSCGLGLFSNDKKNICVLGDQALLYDMNSLALHKQLSQPLHTIVINNSGGGIFSFLPIKNIDDQDFFKKFFTNTHEWSFKGIAETFDINYFQPKTPSDLQTALLSPSSTLIEVKSDIDKNVQDHRLLTTKLANYLSQQL